MSAQPGETGSAGFTRTEGVWVQNSDQPEVTIDLPVGGSGGGILIGFVRHPLEITESPILTWLVGVGAWVQMSAQGEVGWLQEVWTGLGLLMPHLIGMVSTRTPAPTCG